MNYSSVVKTVEYKEPVKYLNGWTYLNKKTHKITDYSSRANTCKNTCAINYDKLITNWNNYRDEQICLDGDRSIYYNYKFELERMIKEEQDILDRIIEYNTIINDEIDYEYDIQ
jgi:hypothetical protein